MNRSRLNAVRTAGLIGLILAATTVTATAKPPRDRFGRPTFGQPNRAQLARTQTAKPLLGLLQTLWRSNTVVTQAH
jgi:hypothetical protein